MTARALLGTLTPLGLGLPLLPLDLAMFLMITVWTATLEMETNRIA